MTEVNMTYISKQSAIQLANELQLSVEGYHLYNQAINNYCAEIADLPEAIVRCKDCKYWSNDELCEKWDHYIGNEDFYCGCAERKTE